MKIYVDLDGTLADFDSHYEAIFGVRPSRITGQDNVDWLKVRDYPHFYRDISPMADMRQLWDFLLPFDPTILTGIPSSVPEAAANKQEWVNKHLGKHVSVICCRSRDKWEYSRAGDVLIDDWERYAHLWRGAGGIWITHRSALKTIEILGLMLRQPRDENEYMDY